MKTLQLSDAQCFAVSRILDDFLSDNNIQDELYIQALQKISLDLSKHSYATLSMDDREEIDETLFGKAVYKEL